TEIVSPFFYSEQRDTQRQWAFPPLMVHTEDSATETSGFQFIYPVLTYHQYGKEHRWQFFQILSLTGGQNQTNMNTRRFTLFPLYFQQRSTDPSKNYTAFVPFYGHLENRLFRDEIDFVLFPMYSKTRKKDVVNYNMPYPFFNKHYGDGMYGWQVWPFIGREHKDVTTRTNSMHEQEVNPGHESEFIMWPFYTQSTNGIGTTNASWQEGLLPLRTSYRSGLRDSDSWGWPLGLTHTIDREKKYVEWDAPWPLVEFAHGEGKTERRVWPFFSRAHNENLEDVWYCWPVYKRNRIHSPPLERERTRIMFFLYSDLKMKSTETGREMRRRDFFPFFSRTRDLNGNERLQVLAILEPIYSGNKGMESEYAPVYSFWRAEKNPKTGAASQSLLWDLYRRDTSPQNKKISLLFGLLQYQSTPAGKRWRVCYIPMGKSRAPAGEKTSGH
ncbi:MAG TPA: hypothetical protein VG754_05715, partial [Verrucomicrobiae bacterium]|nr:hypothetical protein [Verrucomicrobiae bacterium]